MKWWRVSSPSAAANGPNYERPARLVEKRALKVGVGVQDVAGMCSASGSCARRDWRSLKARDEVRINGEVRSHSASKGMLFSFEEIIAHVTRMRR